MTVVTRLADNTSETFECNSYVIGRLKDCNPNIVGVDIYSGGVKVNSFSRPFPFIYKHFIFKSKKVQDKLREIEEGEIQARAKEQSLAQGESGAATEGDVNGQ